MKIKILLAVLLCIALALCFVFVFGGDTEFIFIKTDDGGYEVSGYTGFASEIIIPQSYEDKPVTSIGDAAFYDCTGLTSVTIPSSVTSIGNSAFKNCESLERVTIPSSVTSIGNYAFYGCESLTIYCEAESQPSGYGTYWNSDCIVVWNYKNNDVAEDGYIYTAIDGIRYAIKDKEATVARQPVTCEEANILASITYKGQEYDVTSIGSSAFENCEDLESATIPNSVTSIGNSAFKNCKSLESATIPNSVTSIGNSAFSNCESLESVTIPNSVTSVGNFAFSRCTSLTSVTIPNSVKSIGKFAFYGCGSLTRITIPNSVTSIGFSAFHDCTSLTSITIPFVGATLNGTENTHFGYIFGALHIDDNDGYVPTSLKKVIITGGNSISSSAFYGCTGLKGVSIANCVTSIGDFAFGNCTMLTSVIIPNSVTSIGYSAFYNCGSLISVAISDSVTSMGDYAFSGCKSLTIYCEAESQPSGWESDWNYSGCPVVWGKNEPIIPPQAY